MQDSLSLAHGAVDVSRGGSGRPLAILTARCGTGAGDVSAAKPPELEVWLLCSEYSEWQRFFESECSGRGDTFNSVSRTARLFCAQRAGKGEHHNARHRGSCHFNIQPQWRVLGGARRGLSRASVAVAATH